MKECSIIHAYKNDNEQWLIDHKHISTSLSLIIDLNINDADKITIGFCNEDFDYDTNSLKYIKTVSIDNGVLYLYSYTTENNKNFKVYFGQEIFDYFEGVPENIYFKIYKNDYQK